jgi:pimeloyl-ACP methyl ester carboxylesterase
LEDKVGRYYSQVYKSAEGEKLLKALYHKHLKQITVPYSELFVDTRFGATHIIKYGNPDGIPVLGFHGGNCTNPYSLRPFTRYVDLKKICFIVPDTIGNIGFSSDNHLSSRTLDYGKWASDICDALCYDRIAVFGGSYGAGIALRFAAFASERITRMMLMVPSGIANASPIHMLKIGLPTIAYMRKPADMKKLAHAVRLLMPNYDEEFLEMTDAALQHTKFEMTMPRNAKHKELKQLSAPIYVIAEKYDLLFPGEKVLARAKRIFPNLVGTMLLQTGGHGAFLHDDGERSSFYDVINTFYIENV